MCEELGDFVQDAFGLVFRQQPSALVHTYLMTHERL